MTICFLFELIFYVLRVWSDSEQHKKRDKILADPDLGFLNAIKYNICNFFFYSTHLKNSGLAAVKIILLLYM